VRLRAAALLLIFPLALLSSCRRRLGAGDRRPSIVLLGTGTPRPDPHAAGPAMAVVLGTRVLLFDAGANVERQLAAASLPISGVEALFVTHLHSDHTLGLPDLLLTSWVMGRSAPLPVFGPRGVKAMVGHILDAWREDIAIRTDGLEREAPGGWRAQITEISPGPVYERDGIRVTAFPVKHGSWKEAFGYRVEAPGRSIVISGDTRPCASLAAAARGADVLVHEVYSAAHLAPEKRPGGELWPQYMKEFHTSDRELGEIAARARPKLLVLTHIVRMGATDREILDAVRNGGYTGRVVVGHDLDRF